MDKIIDIKKITKERKQVKNIKKYMSYTTKDCINVLQAYFIPNMSSQPSEVLKQFVTEIKLKRSSYKTQDVEKKKYNEFNFISIDEICGKLLTCNLICYYCKKEVIIFYDKVRQVNQWTLERLDNNIGHTYNNTVIACLGCNLGRRNKNSNGFKFYKQMVIKKI